MATRRTEQGTSEGVRVTHLGEYHLDPPPDGDQDAVRSAIEARRASWELKTAESDKIASTASDIRNRWIAERKKLVTAEAWSDMRDFVRRQRTLIADATPFDRPRLRQEGLHASRELLEGAGVNLSDLRAVNTYFTTELGKVLGPALNEPSGFDVVATPHPVVTPSSDPGFKVFEAPFSGNWSDVDLYTSQDRGVATQVGYDDASTGTMGHRSDLYFTDTDDADVYSLRFETSLGMWYKPKVTGPLRVTVLATCLSAETDVQVMNEFGWSDSITRFWSGFSVYTTGVWADRDVRNVWHASITWDENGHWVSDHVSKGGNAFVAQTTSQPVVANQWVLLEVGTYDSRGAFLNDMSTCQMMRNRWSVNGVIVRPE